MNTTFFSKFTPSIMSKENLRALFVQREWLLKHVFEGLHESVSTGAKHHYLLVGPRGIGKTHFVSLLSYALEELPSYRDDFLIAWLREEEWGVSSFLDLLVRILRSLADRHGELDVAESIESLLECPLDSAEIAAQQLLLDILKNRTLIVIAENLNSLFEGLGDLGQKRFRSLVQESGQISVVATTPVLFSDVQLQSSPFYGFFEVHHLDELSVQEARRLILRMADLERDEQLIAFVNTPEGKARIQAIYHLAGGNHRVYVILSQFLGRTGLDELVGLVLEMIDDLTPYYQAQIASLSTQQQKIIDLMCDKRHALPVKDIAARCFISQQTASSQLKELKDRRFVTSVPVGREQWYELREPLMRICIETKKQRGKPIGLLVELLRTWYSTRELKDIADLSDPGAQMSSLFLKAAWLEKAGSVEPAAKRRKAKHGECAELEESINAALQSHDRPALLRLFGRMVEIRGSAEDWHKYAYCLVLDNQLLRALDAVEKALKLDPELAQANEHRLIILMNLGRFEEALSYTEEWLRKEPSSSKALDFKGSLLAVMDRPDDALEIFRLVTQREPKFSQGWSRLAGTLIKLRRFDDAIDALNQALTVDKSNVYALSLKGYLCGYRGEHYEAIKCFSKAIELEPNDEGIWIGKCMALINVNDYPNALEAAESAMDVDRESLRAHFYRVLALFCNRKWSAYSDELEALMVRSKKNRRPIGDLGALLRFLLEKLHGTDEWREKSTELLLSCQKNETLVQLATGLMNTLPSVVSEDVSLRVARAWVSMWQELARDSDAFALPFRLLTVALKYKQTKSRDEMRILVAEERELFEKLLGEVTVFDSGLLFDQARAHG